MAGSKQASRPITAQDLYAFQLLTDIRLSPDGRQVVYGVQRVDRKTEKKYANLWMAPTDGSGERQFTQGDQTDAMPRWSPDGKNIAFLSSRKEGESTQVYVISMEGGEARRLTDVKGEISNLAWSPDGKTLLLEFTQKDKDVIDRETDEQKKKLGVVARHYTRLFYRADGQGWLGHERTHLWVVDVAKGRMKQLTYGSVYDEFNASWSPDGKSIVFCSNRSDEPDLTPDLVDIYVIRAAGGDMRLIKTSPGAKGMPAFSPDGSQISYIGPRDPNEWWQNVELWVVPADGKGTARSLTRPYDISLTCSTLNDVGGGLQMPPVWSADGKVIYFQISEHGRTKLMAISVADGTLYTVIDEPGSVGTFTTDARQERMAYFFGTMTDPGQVRVRDMDTGNVQQLTHLNQALLSQIDLGKVEEVWFKARDGHDLQGWIMTPPGFHPGKKYPSILEIHGGPQDQYGDLFMHEFYYLAAAGYVVYFSNPRGGTGYGEEHAKAIWGRWGTVDYDDLMDWADFVEKKSYIDRKRMGVTGGSYGGYMTNWIIGHTHRFTAAVTQRSVSNFISMWGTSDVNWVFQFPCGNKSPQESIEVLWDRSPVKYLGNATTPTMVIHSEMDFRCAIEQGQQVFTALKVNRVPSEFVVFPEEPHGLSRTGRTDRRIERLNSIRRWMDTYLKPVATSPVEGGKTTKASK
ncbi:MAG: S9 family peptidase [Candidatus Cryosericum sp.]|nr:S9 family peptidase [bacterium]